jgi:FkbM family methyltransferase
VHPTAALEHAGVEVAIPFAGGRGAEHRTVTEPHLIAALRCALETHRGAFVDVGAYTGQTLVKMLLIEPARRYVGFEPQLAAAAYVARLLEANRASGVIVPAALGDRNGPVELLVAGEFDDAASALEGFRPSSHYAARQTVAMLRGDEVLASLGLEVGVLKIDAEGAELDVLRGFAETIARDQPVIFCEVLPIGDPASEVAGLRQQRAELVEELLVDAGYRTFGIADDGGLLPDARPGAAPPAPRDFVCVPAAETERFAAAVP